MKTIITICLLMCILVSCTQTTDEASIRSEIEKANEEFMNAVAAKDGNAVSALYTEDARLMFPNSPAIEGREAIKEFFGGVISSGITGVKLSTEEVTGTDQFAVESGRYQMLAGDKAVDEGNYLVHWKKVNGKWLLHRDMPSTDQPAPQAIAQPDQTVGIAVFKVKKGQAGKFEGFVRNVLMPACDTSTPEKSQAVRSVRMLRANDTEKDGSQKFVFIFDPRFKEMEYGIEKILVAKHGTEKGKQLMDQFESYTTSFYEYHDMKQLAAN